MENGVGGNELLRYSGTNRPALGTNPRSVVGIGRRPAQAGGR
jgi:hypothetical protein